MLDYPLKFTPILKEKIWGGHKLKTILKKTSSNGNLGESWEISGVENNISVVENGNLKGKSLNLLLAQYQDKLVGKKVYLNFGKEFPLLVKYIDAHSSLSVQLHPNDALARERHNSFGKTEMWFIMQADEDAEINIGFKRSITKEEFLQRLEKGEITQLLNFERVKKGDSFFIPPGRVHAIGAGVLLAEIQQTSDITYRIYDWERKDEQGNSRELHTAQALEAIDFLKKEDFKLPYSTERNKPSNISKSEYFVTNFLPVKGKVVRDHNKTDSFLIYLCVEGNAEISINGNCEKMEKGQTILIPAINKEVIISSESAELLEVYL